MYSHNAAPEIAIIGSGFGFQEILPAILSLGNFKVNLMKPRDYSESKYEAFNLANASFASLDEIANNPQIKLVFLALPPFLQFEYVNRLAPFGKSIYLEKPGGLNAKDALDIKRLIQKNRNNLYIGFHLRFDPVIQKSADHVREFSVTEKRTAKIHWNIKKTKNHKEWKNDLKRGGGVYRDHLCHLVDLLRSVYGFSDECFGSELQLLLEGNDLIDHVSLKSEKLDIQIHRDYDLISSFKIDIETPEDRFQIRNEYPFKLRDYSLIQNMDQVKLSGTLNLDEDARQVALRSYIRRVLIEEFSENSQSDNFKFPSIDDAIFTQKIADRINAL
jgi:hypothetical protein